MMQFKQIYNYSTSVFAIGIILTIFSIGYTFFFELPWLSYPKPIFEIVGRNYYYPNEVVPLQVLVCSSANENKSYLVTHSLKSLDDNRFYILAEAYVSAEPGCKPSISYINRLPGDLPTGKYIIFGASRIKGLFKTHDIKWQTNEFTVLEK